MPVAWREACSWLTPEPWIPGRAEMGASMVEQIKEFFLVGLPQIPVWAKSFLTVLVVTAGGFLLVAMWRPPSTVIQLNPLVAENLRLGVIAFMKNRGEFAAAPSIVFGHAKGIVAKMGTDRDALVRVENEIESRKRNDANWTYANQLNEALALVYALGLTPDTKQQNEVFLQMPLPVESY